MRESTLYIAYWNLILQCEASEQFAAFIIAFVCMKVYVLCVLGVDLILFLSCCFDFVLALGMTGILIAA